VHVDRFADHGQQLGQCLVERQRVIVKQHGLMMPGPG
jgi:hypothetical protein